MYICTHRYTYRCIGIDTIFLFLHFECLSVAHVFSFRSSASHLYMCLRSSFSSSLIWISSPILYRDISLPSRLHAGHPASCLSPFPSVFSAPSALGLGFVFLSSAPRVCLFAQLYPLRVPFVCIDGLHSDCERTTLLPKELHEKKDRILQNPTGSVFALGK